MTVPSSVLTFDTMHQAQLDFEEFHIKGRSKLCLQISYVFSLYKEIFILYLPALKSARGKSVLLLDY